MVGVDTELFEDGLQEIRRELGPVGVGHFLRPRTVDEESFIFSKKWRKGVMKERNKVD